MKAKKCDRCGLYYTENSKHSTFGRIHGGYITGLAFYSDSLGVDSVIDLCDDCLANFYGVFMAEPEADRLN